MLPSEQLTELLARPGPILALAPMQDVTDLPFMKLMTRYGGADLYYTEYFRVHPDSCLEKPILRSVDENPTGRPVIAQMIGNDIPSLVGTAKELMQHPVAAIDLNLGCPAPIVYKKCAGGGLLREPDRIDRILGALREAVTIRFTVKTRIGFEDEGVFDRLLPIFAKHGIDLLTVHGRTVLQMYRDGVRYDLIGRAAAFLGCPVLANGNIASAGDAARIMAETQVSGLMIGRGAIRNPWLFEQIRAHNQGLPVVLPTGREVLAYLHDLYDTVTEPGPEISQVNKLKKYLNFIGVGVEPTGQFLHGMRRCTTRAGLFELCTRYLDHDTPMPLEPFAVTAAAGAGQPE
ncbi:MAG: dihydrouridine synthase [Verrucomicrobiaceae bacterium]|nr:dihydrouridine synthase [Verrucomicrobiaceae bacterium]